MTHHINTNDTGIKPGPEQILVEIVTPERTASGIVLPNKNENSELTNAFIVLEDGSSLKLAPGTRLLAPGANGPANLLRGRRVAFVKPSDVWGWIPLGHELNNYKAPTLQITIEN